MSTWPLVAPAVCSWPTWRESNAVAVAEHTILLALASLKRLIPANAATHAGKWTQRERMSKRDSFELEGKTWGVIGFGTIGREVAKRLAPWGVNLQYFDVRRAAPEQELAAQATYKPLDDLLPLADIVSLHVPLTEQPRYGVEISGEQGTIWFTPAEVSHANLSLGGGS